MYKEVRCTWMYECRERRRQVSDQVLRDPWKSPTGEQAGCREQPGRDVRGEYRRSHKPAMNRGPAEAAASK